MEKALQLKGLLSVAGWGDAHVKGDAMSLLEKADTSYLQSVVPIALLVIFLHCTFDPLLTFRCCSRWRRTSTTKSQPCATTRPTLTSG
jgi:hypothetical protein